MVVYTFLVRSLGPSRPMFSAVLCLKEPHPGFGGMNWVIMLAVAAASWCFHEVEPHHLFKNGGSTDQKLQQKLDGTVNALAGSTNKRIRNSFWPIKFQVCVLAYRICKNCIGRQVWYILLIISGGGGVRGRAGAQSGSCSKTWMGLSTPLAGSNFNKE